MSTNIKEVHTSDDEYQDALSKTNNEINKDKDCQPDLLNLDNNDEWNQPFDDKEDKKTSKEDEFADCLEDLIDENSLKELEKDLTTEELESNREKAKNLKDEGNAAFNDGDFKNSAALYTDALKLCPISYTNDRAILYSNRAAAKISLELKEEAINDCSKAVELNPNYIRALLRRAKLYEDSKKLDESLEDYEKVLKLEKGNNEACKALIRIPPLIEARNNELKDEMVGKLKELGNMFLKPFGLSTNNFQMQKDENTGSYSINFNQKPS